VLRIIVIGNCTSLVIGDCLRALRPHDRITAFFPERDSIPTADKTGNRFVRRLERIAPRIARRWFHLPIRTAEDLTKIEFDYAFASAHLAGSALVKSVRSRTPVILWPNLVFQGYHPDCTYLAVDGRKARSPMGDYHSRIVTAAYAAGLSIAETARLFNKLVYVRLGYLKRFALAKSALAEDFVKHGYDFACVEGEWVTAGPFMHTINHPKLPVCASIARQMLSRARLEIRDVNLGDRVHDELANMPQWPVYPEIAATLGMSGSTSFKTSRYGSFAGRVMQLSEYIESSFARYREDGFDSASFARLETVSTAVKSIGL
jgi:hypothetical protein